MTRCAGDAKIWCRNFNPHEREARDATQILHPMFPLILIHTSVKLVTSICAALKGRHIDFNPHEREARDDVEA